MAATPKPTPPSRTLLRFAGPPAFAVRGFMLDISRGKVPTRREFTGLVELLAALRYNHFQLYIEHTFAFSRHRRVWRGISPLTPEDILWLQSKCDEAGIELSANFNSFGHFERWLKHPEYKHLAECPGGFTHPLKGRVSQGTTLRPNAASLRFLDSLWKEYLPLFESPRFNLGGDEPWELGQGWSKPLAKKYGKHRVYLHFLKKLHRLAKKHGKETLFWADILLEAPALVQEVPRAATALLWGYEANHPFAGQCKKLAAAKRKFWVCPGTSAWNTFTGRTDNMLANIASAVKYGQKYGAEGLMLTSWGDGGNHQPWPVMYPGLAYAADLVWNRQRAGRADLVTTLRKTSVGILADALLRLGRVENAISCPQPNRSRHHALFFATRELLGKELKTLSLAELRQAVRALASVRRKLAQAPNLENSKSVDREELLLGADMAAWAVRRAQLAKAGKSTKPLTGELRRLIRRFGELWCRRARPGGLRESLARMRAVENEL